MTEWRKVPGHPEYEVSDAGEVRSMRDRWPRQAPKMLRPWVTPEGYRQVTMSSDGGRRKKAFVHQLVLLAFVGPRPPECRDVRHLDGDGHNNRLGNLAYGTSSENQYDKVRHGTHHYSSRVACPFGHAFDDRNTRVRPSGARVCRTCSNAYYRIRRTLTPEERADRKAAGLPVVDLAAYFAEEEAA